MLYPNDEAIQGKELRLEQQYFFVSCSLQDMLRIMRGQKIPLRALPREVRGAAERHASGHRGRRADAPAGRRARRAVGRRPGTSPAAPSATPTTRCCPRRWSAGRSRCSAALLPRHLEIIYEINARFLDEVRLRFLGDDARVARAVADRRERRALRAHGASRLRRQPCDQRRGRAALRAAEAETCWRISTRCGRTSSATRPTASRRGAGWRSAIRGSRA